MRNITKFIGACLCALYLSGCASTKSVDVVSTEKIDAPKVIAISGSKGLWVKEIQKRLRNKGFTIKRSV
ncbi:hypothetical protein, partial [Klebsiella oxytoca]|uniref:hypothetical protein n=3 Tax=Klebsiella/Raoultella group TaxID=2890311 RepID=UPI001CCBE8D8